LSIVLYVGRTMTMPVRIYLSVPARGLATRFVDILS
jgi:hypothetical protein